MAEPPLLFPMAPQSSAQRPPSGLASSDWRDPAQNEAEGLPRRQSVRFIGPCSTQVASQGAPTSCCSPADRRRTRDGREQRPDAEALGLPGRVASPVHVSPMAAASYLASLDAAEESYTPEDDIASAPSSYRRLHRSRSMLAELPGVRSCHESSGPPLASTSRRSRPFYASTSRRLFQSEPSHGGSSREVQALKAPKSMSFLTARMSRARLSPNRDGSASSSVRSGLPDVPEDGFSGTGGRTSQPTDKSSALVGSVSRRSDASMPKSLRGSSSTEDFGAATVESQQCPQEPATTLKSRARQVSRSLRVRLKSLFVASKSEEEALSIPCQHIEARRTHVVTGGQTRSTDVEQSAEGSQEEHLRSPPAKAPVLHAPAELVHSRKASVDSLKSGGRDDRKGSGSSSSLTSWVHSGPSTLTSQEQQQWREWEKQRLSVIGENDAHVPSPSLRRQLVGSETFRPPAEPVEGQGPPRQKVDSQRIYSALVKRMQATDGTNAREGLEEQAGSGITEPPFSVTDKRAERDSTGTPATIRRISQEHECTTASHDEDPVTARNSAAPRRAEACANWRASDTGSPAPHLFRTGSHYRRALRRSIQEEQDAWAQQRAAVGQESDKDTEVRYVGDANRLPEADSDSAKDLVYSDSAYSSDEDEGGTAKESDAGRRRGSPGTPPMSRLGGCREGSTASSVGWKALLSASFDRFDPAVSPLRPSKTRLSQPREASGTAPRQFASVRGHVRELAQISDDNERDRKDAETYNGGEDDVFFYQSAAERQTAWADAAPLGQIQPNVIANPFPLPLRHAGSIKRRFTPPSLGGTRIASGHLLVENESPTRFPPPPPSPPPIPPRSKLRPEPLRIWRPNGGDGDGAAHPGGSESGRASVLSSPGLTEAVRRQFGGSHVGLGPGFGPGLSGDGGPKAERWACVGPPGIAQVLGGGAECEQGWAEEGSAFV
ncbi:hypothetical protein VTH06DRAFT_8583 [Thermothelomyces fergusii]